MPVQVCPQKITCGECLDFPIENFSAEAPDSPTFVAVKNFVDDPKLGNIWNRTGCIGICFSTVSQQAADDCALQQAQLCTLDSDGCSGGLCGDWREPVIGDGYTSRQIFFSNAQNCSFECPDGNTTLSFSLPAGAVLSTISQADADVRAQAMCQQRLQQQALSDDSCVSVAKACFTDETEYEFQFPQSGGSPPWFYTVISGSLSGLTLEENGLLHGFPVAPGNFPFEIEAHDQTGLTIRYQGTFVVMEISTVTPLPDGSVNTVYGQQLNQTGGTTPLLWTVVSGSLPPGLSLNPTTGIISGTPTTQGTFNFVVQFTDSST